MINFKKTNKYLSAALGTLLLIITLASGLLAKPYAYPVPFVPKKNHQLIYFRDLPGPGTIKIYTITGEEVVSLRVTEDNDLPSWDAKNASGKLVASGVYLYLIETGSEVTTGKLVIIR